MLVGRQGRRARSRARATYKSNFRATLLSSASESAAAPESSILFQPRLQQGEDGQRCSRRDLIGTAQGTRDLLERRQRRVALERLRERRGARVADLVVN